MLGVEILERNGAFTVVLTAPAGAQAGAAANIRRELERYTFRVEIGTCKSPAEPGGSR
jgi:hypothetical protein